MEYLGYLMHLSLKEEIELLKIYEDELFISNKMSQLDVTEKVNINKDGKIYFMFSEINHNTWFMNLIKINNKFSSNIMFNFIDGTDFIESTLDSEFENQHKVILIPPESITQYLGNVTEGLSNVAMNSLEAAGRIQVEGFESMMTEGFTIIRKSIDEYITTKKDSAK